MQLHEISRQNWKTKRALEWLLRIYQRILMILKMQSLCNFLTLIKMKQILRLGLGLSLLPKKPPDKSTETCQIKAPIVNPEIWKLLNSWQRKSDVKFSAIQKSMIKSFSASLSIVEHIQKGRIDLQFVAQTTADIAAMLGQASYDISLKRKQFIKSVIKDEYKDLCSTSEITEFLFGNDLPNRIKELNLTSKLANTNRVSNRMKADRRSCNRYKPYTPRRGPF